MNRRLRLVSALLALGWMALIFYLSGIPNAKLPQGPDGTDKLIHMAVYGLLALFYLGAMKPASDGRHSLRQTVLAAMLATLYGATDEWHQSFVPTRSADVWDLVADAVGAVIAVTVVAWLHGPLPWLRNARKEM